MKITVELRWIDEANCAQIINADALNSNACVFTKEMTHPLPPSISLLVSDFLQLKKEDVRAKLEEKVLPLVKALYPEDEITVRWV